MGNLIPNFRVIRKYFGKEWFISVKLGLLILKNKKFILTKSRDIERPTVIVCQTILLNDKKMYPNSDSELMWWFE